MFWHLRNTTIFQSNSGAIKLLSFWQLFPLDEPKQDRLGREIKNALLRKMALREMFSKQFFKGEKMLEDLFIE